MAVGRVDIVMEERGLRIVIEPESDLLRGVHLIYLSNVLGLERSEEFSGYVGAGPASLDFLKRVVGYLRGQNIGFELNDKAQEIVARLDEEKEQLARSIAEGRRLKRKPVHQVDVPGLARPLKDYQVPAVAHLIVVVNGANFSVPGSGKTSIVLSAFRLLESEGRIEKLVVVGPRASFMPWEEEYQACFGREPRSVRIVGAPSVRKELYEIADSKELVLLTYQMANNDADDLSAYLRRHKSMLVLDESHNIKRLEGGVWADTLLELAPNATRRVVLTGTPVPNSLLDLWSQITFLWPNRLALGEREAFKRKVEAAGEDAPKEVREQLYPLFWRIRKKDLHLPRPRFHRIDVRMSRYQQAIYDALAAKVLADVTQAPEERARLRLWRKARMVRLLQAASNPTLLTEYSTEFKIPPLNASGLPVDKLIEEYPEFESPSKFDAAVELIRELVAKGQKVLVWTAFIHNIKTLQRKLADLSPAIIYGDIPKDEDEDASYNREQIIRDFKQTDRYKVLIANPSACAESISLQKACFHAVYLDRTFNAAHYMQSQDRIHRIGLDPTDIVHYYILRSKDSVDEVIDARLEHKIHMMEKVLAEDFGTLNLDSPEEEFTEESEEEKDFNALVSDLRTRYGGDTS